MPAQKPGRSKQDYETPEDFLDAVKCLLGIQQFSIDLAASAENAKADRFYGVAENALVCPWTPFCSFTDQWAWCNPPFAQIAPWVEKASHEADAGGQIAMLLPAAVGANWYRDWVHKRAQVLALNGRLTFVGETICYPKDRLLVLWDQTRQPDFLVWTWREPK